MENFGTESPSDAGSDLFGMDWGDDPVVIINSVTERHDRTRGGKELLAFVDSGAVDNVLPKMVCTEPFRLRGAVACSPYGCGFRRVFTGWAERKSHHEKKACKTAH